MRCFRRAIKQTSDLLARQGGISARERGCALKIPIRQVTGQVTIRRPRPPLGSRLPRANASRCLISSCCTLHCSVGRCTIAAPTLLAAPARPCPHRQNLTNLDLCSLDCRSFCYQIGHYYMLGPWLNETSPTGRVGAIVSRRRNCVIGASHANKDFDVTEWVKLVCWCWCWLTCITRAHCTLHSAQYSFLFTATLSWRTQ